MGTETIVSREGGARDAEKNFASVALVTSSVNDHAHAVRVFVGPEDGPVVVGETSFSTGDAEKEQPHSHPFTLDLETGELRIAEADDHVHRVDAAELARAMEDVRARTAEGDGLALARTDDRGPGVRVARRALSNAQVGFVSLCRRGMNGIRTLLKSDGRFSFSSSLSKMDKEGLLHTLVWVPDLPCHEGDVMTAEEVRKMAHAFLPNGGRIDVEHDGKPLSSDQVSVAEHYVVPPGDPKFRGIRTSEGAEVDPTGGWGLILKIHDPDIRADYESGEWDGVSLAGRAEVLPVGKARVPGTQPPTPEEDFDMTPEERKQFAKELAEQVTNGLSAILKQSAAPAPEADPDPAPKAPAIEPPEDMNDPEALEKYLDELFVASLDMTKQADVQRLIKHRRKQAEDRRKDEEAVAKAKADADAKAAADAAAAAGETEDVELAKARAEAEEAKARLEKLEKASRQPGKADGDDKPTSKVSNLSKSEDDQWKIGRELASKMKQRAVA